MGWEKFMKISLKEAELALKEGNKGYGAVIVSRGKIVAKAHNTEVTDSDPTAHAEINAIRKAAKKLSGLGFEGSTIIATHEPCPMCSAACIWAGLTRIVYGASMEETAKLGKKRIPVRCRFLIEKASASIEIVEGVLSEECLNLYKRIGVK
ncbi:nucleoside deaminase [Candidatus Hecatella orcuttiae]|jgi:guanine deaminase|uniref:nucleoside deaminase n=1 Tax=Candidatus Hecatella orcuttiae TaxID=1935119 RepID=UPI002867D9C3|nr:nucleoside deaminase [Candidatus Hecatella orcuttiae]